MKFDGRKLKSVIANSPFNTVQVAERSGVSSSVLYDWINGGAVPTVNNLAAVAAVLGVPLESIGTFFSPENPKDRTA